MGGLFSYKLLVNNTKIEYILPNEITSNEAIPYVVSNVQDGVVGISTISVKNIFSEEKEGLGSGFIFSEDGLILTNYHVIDGYTNLTILFNNGSSSPAKVVNYDVDRDLAVLQVAKGTKLPKVLKLGNSKELKQGETVIAIGNPLGKQFLGTATSGIVSAIDRELNLVNGVQTYIQTDAAINRGNSGGPLLNLKGEVIGINTVKIEEDGVEGISFAIPINIVNKEIEELSKSRIKIGFNSKDITEEIAKQFDLPIGVYVINVEEDSIAAKSGLKTGDVIVKMDNKNINSIDEIIKIKNKKKNGDVSKLTVSRDGALIDVEIYY